MQLSLTPRILPRKAKKKEHCIIYVTVLTHGMSWYGSLLVLKVLGSFQLFLHARVISKVRFTFAAKCQKPGNDSSS